MLGLSAAILGRWVERVGPRKTIFASACCFCGGLWLSSLGVALHNIWLVYLGYGVIGGIGLGLGYIAPVSTLVKWFPDRPGMATGLAIMGFGGGALIGAPLGVELMGYFKSDTSVGVKEAFLVMGGALLRLHDVRRVHLPRARTRVATGGIRSPDDAEETRHAGGRLGGRCMEDAAVLAPVGGALPECHGRDRHPRPGVADVSGHVRSARGGRWRFRGPAQPVQHGRPPLLVLDVRPDGTQGHLLRFLPSRGRPLFPRPDGPEVSQRGAVRLRSRL